MHIINANFQIHVYLRIKYQIRVLILQRYHTEIRVN